MGDIMLVQDTAGVLTSLDKFLRGERSVQKTSGCTKQALNSTATGPLALIILRIPISQDGTSGDHWENVGPAPVLVFAPPGRAAPVGYAKIGIQDDEPRHQRELLCSIESLLSSVLDKLAQTDALHQFGSVRVDLRRTEVWRDGERVVLAAREFQLLRYLIEHRGATLSRQELLKEVWGYRVPTSTRTVDVHIAGLRQKIERNPKQPQLILTIKGLGYKFAA